MGFISITKMAFLAQLSGILSQILNRCDKKIFAYHINQLLEQVLSVFITIKQLVVSEIRIVSEIFTLSRLHAYGIHLH